MVGRVEQLLELAGKAGDDLNDRAGEEWESLRLLSFHGAPWNENEWLADLTRDDVDKIAALINELAASRRAAVNLVEPLARDWQRMREAIDALHEEKCGWHAEWSKVVARERALRVALERIAAWPPHDGMVGLCEVARDALAAVSGGPDE